jgi:hypothetical protein
MKSILQQTFARSLLAIAATLAVCLPAQATTYSTDYTDLWYNPAEAGWGINVIQQYNTIFATLFVYAGDSSPTWFVASDVEPAPAGSLNSFSGTLYRTTGPAYSAGAFNPGSVVASSVGTITFSFTSENTATLQYSVNGATYTKSIQRQTWRSDAIAGNYFGGLTAAGTSCSGVSNGDVLIVGTMSAQQTSTQATFAVQFQNTSGSQQCSFTGAYSQAGSHGSVAGSWSCTTGNSGSFTLSSIQANVNGFTARFHGNDQYCTYDGYFGGPRDVI